MSEADGGSGSPTALARAALASLGACGQTLAVAESLTGGALTSALVDVAGASAVVRGAVVAYATDVKATLLGVDAALLAEAGAVDPRVAEQMAEGVRSRLGADVGLATTGVAGPAEQDGRPPGTVHVAVAWDGGSAVRSARLPGGRAEVRRQAVLTALRLLLDCPRPGVDRPPPRVDPVEQAPGHARCDG